MIDLQLWRQVQRLVYPKRFPSSHPPFPRSITSPAHKRASWLYYQLAEDAQLRAKVLP